MIKKALCAIIALFIFVLPGHIVQADGTSASVPEGVPSCDPYYTNSFTVVCSADDRGNYISDYTFTVSSNSAGHVSIGVSITTNQTMQKLGFTSLTLQHWNGSSWDDAWTKTNQFDTSTDYYAYVKTISNLYSDDYYRVCVVLYAKKGFLQTQTLSLVSDYIRCK